MSKKIILLAGPTASGKSKLVIQLAKKLNGEIINADSMQIYKEFSVLSSRPDSKEIKKAKHNLYGVISVKKYFSAGDWLKLAKNKINHCHKNRKIPIIADEYVDSDFGTGVVKVTPAHDFNDYEVGQRHKLPLINILTLDGLINENGSDQYEGLNRFEARKKY